MRHTINKVACYILSIDCLLIALDARMFSHNVYGPGTKDQGPKAAGPGPERFGLFHFSTECVLSIKGHQ